MRRKDPVAVHLVEAEEAAEVRHIIFPQLRPVVRRDGRVIYRATDGGVVTDEAHNVRVDRVTAGATLLALSLAAERFGDRPLVVRGTDEFLLQAATLAGREGLDIAFSDQGLERRRVASRSGLTKSLEPGDKPGNKAHVITRDEKRGIEGDERGRD
jgi:hypothetical protein